VQQGCGGERTWIAAASSVKMKEAASKLEMIVIAVSREKGKKVRKAEVMEWGKKACGSGRRFNFLN